MNVTTCFHFDRRFVIVYLSHILQRQLTQEKKNQRIKIKLK
jgi:hypothetical protein